MDTWRFLLCEKRHNDWNFKDDDLPRKLLNNSSCWSFITIIVWTRYFTIYLSFIPVNTYWLYIVPSIFQPLIIFPFQVLEPQAASVHQPVMRLSYSQCALVITPPRSRTVFWSWLSKSYSSSSSRPSHCDTTISVSLAAETLCFFQCTFLNPNEFVLYMQKERCRGDCIADANESYHSRGFFVIPNVLLLFLFYDKVEWL